MQLRQPETLGILDHHGGRLGHIDADFDDGGRDQQFQSAGLEVGHRLVLVRPLHAAMHQPHLALELHRQLLETILGGGKVNDLAFFHQRAHPIGAVALRHGTAKPAHHLVQPRHRQHPRIDRQPSRRLLGELRHIHVTINRQRQGARDGCRRHHQQVGGAVRLGLQCQALMHAEAMLFVDDRKSEVVEDHVLLKKRMRADDQLHLA